jgi:hypothetical protein
MARSAQRVPLKEVGGWVAPWFMGALLAGAALLGFLTASGAQEFDTYAAGMVTGGLALVALGWLVKRSFDHGTEGWLFDILVDRPESLLLLVAALTAIGIGGLFLAADVRGTAEIIGYALFVVSVLVTGWNLKHYYDRTDSRPRDRRM